MLAFPPLLTRNHFSTGSTGEEGCSLRNAWRLYYVPWTPPVREALKDEEAKTTTWAYRGIHSTLRTQQ